MVTRRPLLWLLLTSLFYVPSFCQFHNISLSAFSTTIETVTSGGSTFTIFSTEFSSVPIETTAPQTTTGSLTSDAQPVTTADPSSMAVESAAIVALGDELATLPKLVTGIDWLDPSPIPTEVYPTSEFEPITASISGKPAQITFVGEVAPLPSSAVHISDDDAISQSKSLLEVLKGNPDTTAFAALLEQNPDILKLLDPKQHYTVLAPSNNAIAERAASGLLKRDVPLDVVDHFTGGRGNSPQPLGAKPETLDTIQKDPQWVNMGPDQPFRVVSQPSGSGLVPRDTTGSNVTIISGQGKRSSVSPKVLTYDSGLIHIVEPMFTQPKSLPETLDDLGYKNFKKALNKAGMLEKLSQTPRITIFVPKEDFVAGDFSTTVLNHHILKGALGYTPNLLNPDTRPSVASQSDTIKIITDNEQIWVNNARIVQGDIIMTNGVLHIVDDIVKDVGSAHKLADANSGGSDSGNAGGGSSSDDNSGQSGVAILRPTITFFVAGIICCITVRYSLFS